MLPEAVPPGGQDGAVAILGVPFPRWSADAALAWLLGRLGGGEATAVCFPDMSTLNLCAERPAFRALLQRRVYTLNDGAGLAWAARRQGRPFPANLNGTDLCPRLFAAAPSGTRVFLLGARPGVAERARAAFASRFPHLDFVGARHGYLDAAAEEAAVADIAARRAQIVLVAMGNPLQVELIDRHRDDERLRGVLWLAVGGLLDYYGGDLVRAPGWVRRARLEWLHLVLRQPHKARRYFVGIPRFLGRCLWAERTGGHAPPAPPPSSPPASQGPSGAARA